MNAYILAFAVLLVTHRAASATSGAGASSSSPAWCSSRSGRWPAASPRRIYLLIAFRVLQGIGGAAMMPATLSIIATVFAPEQARRGDGRVGRRVRPGLGPSVPRSAASSSSTSPGRRSPTAGAGSSSSTSPSASPACCSPCASCPRAGTPPPSSRSTCPASACSRPRSSASRSPSSRARSTAGRRRRSSACSPAPLAAFLLFYWREHRVSQPLIDFSLFRSLNFAAGNATGLLLSAAMMGAFFTIPIFLQSVLGFSAIKAGLVMAPMSVVIIFAAPVAGMLSDRLGSKWIVAAGMFLLAVGPRLDGRARSRAWRRSTPATTSASLIVPFLISGIGIGFAVAPVTSAVMATAPKDRVGNASGVLSTMRQVGSLMGIAILGAVLQNRVTANITEGVQAISQIPDAIKQKIIAAAAGGSMQMGAPSGGSSMPAAARAVMETLFKGWFTNAIASAFIVAVVLAVAGGLCALLLRSHVKDAQEAAATAPAAGRAARGRGRRAPTRCDGT